MLTDYIRLRKNTQIEIYNFRSYKQSLDEFVTELRKLAKNCEITDTDKEIPAKISTSTRTCRTTKRGKNRRNTTVKTPVKEISIETENTSLDECVRTRDSEAKYKMKTSADMKNHAVDRGISVGDTVVVKRDIHGNKFDMEPRTKISRKGPMLT